jgi:glycosyltransferase involved in cell wall biosynthesis
VSVCVLIPNWNRAKTLGRAIASATIQRPDEVIVVDDASDDDSVDVARRCGVTVITRAAKSDNWVEALGETIEQIAQDYVICMGADDVICPPFVEVVRGQCGAADKPGVIWGDYALMREGDDLQAVPVGVRENGFGQLTTFSPEESAERFRQSGADRWECGVGAAIRRDLLVWLQREEYWRMGPWSDSVGYVVAAIRGGCAYSPGVFAGFVVHQEKPSYHQQILSDSAKRQEYGVAVAAWLKRPAIAPLVAGVAFDTGGN